MNWIPLLVAILIGFVLGLVTAFVFRLVQAKTAKELAEELFSENEARSKRPGSWYILNLDYPSRIIYHFPFCLSVYNQHQRFNRVAAVGNYGSGPEFP